jgi:hypothetical protein
MWGSMHLELSHEETAALIRELHDIVESDRFPLSPRIRTLQGILDQARRAAAGPRALTPTEALRAAAIHPRTAPTGMKSRTTVGPPATLGSTAEAQLRLIIWCLDCRHEAEPDPAEMAERYGAEMTVPDWAVRLVCGECGSWRVNRW